MIALTVPAADPDLDLSISRVIAAPPSAIWRAWTTPALFEQWWVPAPARCRVVAMELAPGGAFETTFCEDGEEFVPHLRGCFLEVAPEERLVFTDALTGGWRPGDHPFMTAVITLTPHPEGTLYAARVMHKSTADRDEHETMGFFDGWGTVIGQLAELVEAGAAR